MSAARTLARLRDGRVSGPAAVALLLAGGALSVRVAVLAAAGHGGPSAGLFTAAAVVLAGVALALIALPRLAGDGAGSDQPEMAESRDATPATTSATISAAGRGGPASPAA